MGIPRTEPGAIAHAVALGGRITPPTLTRLLDELAKKTDYPHHIAVEITVGGLLKVVDNEADALETIRRLEHAAVKS
ncbi:MAG: hypothetical protein JWM74_4162 [Myxococcaceae bacterium]|nr:hypothetical protein [Myxococcaceae bacterium]